MTSRRVDRINFGTHRLTSFQVRVLQDGQNCVALRGLRAARDERLSLGRAFQWSPGGTTKNETLQSLFLLPRRRRASCGRGSAGLVAPPSRFSREISL